MRFEIPEKLSLTLFLVVLAMAAAWYINVGLALLLVLARLAIPSFRPISATASRRFWKLFRYFSLAGLLMVVLNGLLIPEGVSLRVLSFFDLYSAGLEFGLTTAARLLAIGTSLLVFFGSTSMSDIAGFLHRVGLPTQLVMTLLLTLHFFDQLPDRMNRILLAQEARGAPVRGNLLRRILSLFSLLSPLLLSSIVESIDRGLALELRGFHGGTKLSFSSVQHGTKRLSVTVRIFLALTIISVIWLIRQWLLQ